MCPTGFPTKELHHAERAKRRSQWESAPLRKEKWRQYRRGRMLRGLGIQHLAVNNNNRGGGGKCLLGKIYRVKTGVRERITQGIYGTPTRWAVSKRTGKQYSKGENGRGILTILGTMLGVSGSRVKGGKSIPNTAGEKSGREGGGGWVHQLGI